MNQKKTEDAVSPVIGIMLILVVTIVIAAVVAAFAGGLGMDVEPAPVTAVDIVSVSSGETKDRYKTQIVGANVETGFDMTTMHVMRKYSCPETNTVFAQEDLQTVDPVTGTIALTIVDQELYNKYAQEVYDGTEFKYAPSITISSLHGDILDLSKVSVKVYYSDEKFLEQQDTLSGTLTPGNKITIALNAEKDGNGVGVINNMNSRVDVVVYYGNHIIADAENLKVR